MTTIKIENLTKTIKKNTVLSDINMEMSGGSIYGLRGKNGCGKTMLMRAVCGLIHPTKGQIVINDQVLHRDISFPESIGALIENPSFLEEYSGRKNLELLNRLNGNRDPEAVSLALERVCLQDDADKLYGRYSLGMKQKLGIAYAILNEPDIIVLDEPINALDEDSVAHIRKTLYELRDSGRLILIACHDREEMDYLADEIFVMSEGRVIRKERNDAHAAADEA